MERCSTPFGILYVGTWLIDLNARRVEVGAQRLSASYMLELWGGDKEPSLWKGAQRLSASYMLEQVDRSFGRR